MYQLPAIKKYTKNGGEITFHLCGAAKRDVIESISHRTDNKEITGQIVFNGSFLALMGLHNECYVTIDSIDANTMQPVRKTFLGIKLLNIYEDEFGCFRSDYHATYVTEWGKIYESCNTG